MQMSLPLRRKKRRITTALSGFISFIREVIDEFLTDNCPHLAASVSYYLLFSLFPLTLAAVSVLGFLSRSPDVADRVIEAIGDYIPIESEYITNAIEEVVDARAATGAIATLMLLWGGTSVFNAMRKALNAAWGIKAPRPFIVERVVEFGMMFGLGLLLLLSFSLTTLVSILREFSLDFTGSSFLNGDAFWHFLIILLSVSLSFVTFLLLYRFVPNTRVRWSDVWGGALLAAVAFEAAKQIFLWYATNFTHQNLIYGSLGGLIALMVWTYISTMILLFCAKLTAVYSRSHSFSINGALRRNRRKIRNRIHSLSPTAQFGAPNSSLESYKEKPKEINKS